jgi:hypothetical protein
MIALVVLHAVVAALAPAVGHRVGRRVFLWTAIPSVVTLIWLAANLGDVLDGTPVTESYNCFSRYPPDHNRFGQTHYI